MKATGIVRRIDDLGRVVIPKEIRRTMRIREGDPLEIYTNENEIVLKKYSTIAELNRPAAELAAALASVSGKTALITDKDAVIAAAGPNKAEYKEAGLSSDLLAAYENRRTLLLGREACTRLCDHTAQCGASQAIAPIVAAGDVIGGVVIVSDSEQPAETDKLLVELAAKYLGRENE